MGKLATKKATAQLQKLFDFLGKYGGVIQTNEPDTWWNLDLEVETDNLSRKFITIGVFNLENSDCIFDPQFEVILSMDENKILECEIERCTEQTIFGTTFVDSSNNLHGFGNIEKDPYGLTERFSQFMNNMVEIGPYLKEPKEVKKYTKTLAE